jgi:hypothetical protein
MFDFILSLEVTAAQEISSPPGVLSQCCVWFDCASTEVACTPVLPRAHFFDASFVF